MEFWLFFLKAKGQALSEVDPTVLSIDGISGYALISRRAMLSALARAEGQVSVREIVRRRFPVLGGRRGGGRSRSGSRRRG